MILGILVKIFYDNFSPPFNLLPTPLLLEYMQQIVKV